MYIWLVKISLYFKTFSTWTGADLIIIDWLVWSLANYRQKSLCWTNPKSWLCSLPERLPDHVCECHWSTATNGPVTRIRLATVQLPASHQSSCVRSKWGFYWSPVPSPVSSGARGLSDWLKYCWNIVSLRSWLGKVSAKLLQIPHVGPHQHRQIGQ